MQTVFTALILSRITYAISVWGGHLTNQQRQRINAFLKLARKFGFNKTLYCIEDLLEKSDTRLFTGLKTLLIAFIPSYLVIINPVSCFWEKEGIHLPFHTVLIICIKLVRPPLSFLSSYNVCVSVFYTMFLYFILCAILSSLYQFLCIAHVWRVTIKIYLLTYLLTYLHGQNKTVLSCPCRRCELGITKQRAAPTALCRMWPYFA